MNENLDLTRILRDTPLGTRLYSPVCGDIYLESVMPQEKYCITCHLPMKKDVIYCFTAEGCLEPGGELLLFPSKGQRDWSKFNKKERRSVTLHPFDKVLVRDDTDGFRAWRPAFLSHIHCGDYRIFEMIGDATCWDDCIPYNKDTQHLAFTLDDCIIDYDITFSSDNPDSE